MMLGTLTLFERVPIVFLSGVAAGVINAVAGGGTFVTFPTLLSVGIPALQANLSTTVGVVPSFLGSFRVLRRQLEPHRRLIISLLPSCLLGTAAGCTLLLEGSPSTFRSVVPWLIGAGTVMFGASPLLTRALSHVDHAHHARRGALYVGIFFVSAYGGYFGAGLGILLLAVLGLALPFTILELQGLRTALSLVISFGAALVFVLHGGLALWAVFTLLGGTFLGGWLGAMAVVSLSSTWVRAVVIVVGVATTIKLAVGS